MVAPAGACLSLHVSRMPGSPMAVRRGDQVETWSQQRVLLHGTGTVKLLRPTGLRLEASFFLRVDYQSTRDVLL